MGQWQTALTRWTLRLVEQRDAASPTAPSANASAVEQKLHAVLRRFDQIEKRLAEMDRANRK